MIAHILGDSHASFFSGYNEIQPCYPESSKNKYPFFKAYRLGSVLAYNLVNTGTTEKGREKLLELVSKIDKHDIIFFHFGEIDCRCHLIKQAHIQRKPIEVIVQDCVNNYFKAVEEIKSMGFNVGVVGVIPSAESDNPEFPVYGSMEERNKCSIQFNAFLENRCKEGGVYFVSLFNYLINGNLKSKTQFYFDTIHLGQLGMPFAIREFQRIIPALIEGHISNIEISLRIFYAKILAFLKLINRKRLKQI